MLTACLTRLSIDAAIDIFVNSPNEIVKLNCTHISCRNLGIDAKQVFVLDNKDKSESVLVANRCDYNTDITLDDKSSLLSTYWENGNVYPWISSYNDNYKYSSDSDEIAWGTHIRSILGWFRKDKRATFGKHKEMIDNVAVGSNENKRLVLEFLKVKKNYYGDIECSKILH